MVGVRQEKKEIKLRKENIMKFGKTFLMIAVSFAILISSSCKNESHQNAVDNEKDVASDNLSHTRVTIPGTGVSLVSPTGTVLAPAGPYFIDDKGEMVVSVLLRQAEKDRDKDLSTKLYPHFVRKIKVGNQVGDLHKRTRKIDGGGYDAFWLGIYRGSRLLQVTAYYTGNIDSAFQSMESIFPTILWESDKEDRFLSFGYKISVEGLSEIPKGIGILSFGKQINSDSNVSIELSPLPIISERIGDSVSYCNKLAARIFIGELRTGPTVLKKNNIELWEMTGHTKFNKSGTVDYVGYLKTSEGGFIQAIGKAPVDSIEKWESRFREALLSAERVR